MTTSGLSLAGFVLSIIANVWAFGLTFVRWPRVSVETNRYLYITTGPSQDKVVLTVINRGSEAVTISNIGLRTEDRSQQRDFAYDAIHNPDRLPESPLGPLLLPVRLEGHGALRWIYGPQQLTEFQRGIAVKGYAKVYKSFRWRSDITERTIDAPRTEQIDSVT